VAKDDFPPTHPEAGREIEDAILFEERRSPEAARRLSLRIKALMALVQEQPGAGSPHLRGTRRLLLRSFPYAIIDVPRDGGLLVVAFAHASRRPGYWIHRLN
jgi:plasmid stabilization system protein ParE